MSNQVFIPGPRVTHKDILEYRYHRHQVKNAHKKINNVAPKLDLEQYFNPGAYKNDLNRVAEVEEQNRGFIQRMNVAYRGKGTIDTGPHTDYLKKSDYISRLIKYKKIEVANLGILDRIIAAPVYYEAKRFEREYAAFLEKVIFLSKHPEYYKEKKNSKDQWSIIPIGIDKALCCAQKRVRCFFDLEVLNDRKLGRMVMEIYCDIVPLASENFIGFCRGFGELTFKKTPFHRIVPDVLVTGGDVTNRTGTGGTSIYGEFFPDENHYLKFAGPGVISTYNFTKDQNNSQFLILCKEMQTLNGRFVVFGRVIQGLRILQMMGEFGTKSGKPIKKVIISECGVLE